MADHPDHSNGILFESFLRIADRSDHPLFKILHPSHEVNDRKIGNIVKKTIDGNVAAKGILTGRSKTVCPDNRPIFGFNFFVLRSTSKSRNLNNLSSFKEDLNEPKPPPDDSAVPEEGVHLMGVGICGDIKILRDFSQKEIPDASSDEKGQESVVMETIENFKGLFIDPLS
jgi:hypothetical protein